MERIHYAPNWESLDQHKIPSWFLDAKLGIFIHWGVYSVPAWAPLYHNKGDYYNEEIGNHPYAELYGYGMTYKDSEFWKYHLKKYGPDFQYEDFIPMFKAEHWEPNEWARLFRSVGAKYVVLVTKHSDGYCMWDTNYSQRNSMLTGPKRDITGELCKAVESQGLKMGLYFSTTFNFYYDRTAHITYRDLTHKMVRELIDRYKPSILWSDDYWKPEEKSFELTWKSRELISYFYNQAKDPDDVVVNDRWGVTEDGRQYGDFSTPEYRVLPETPDFYWELTRGIGQSYGYNQAETASDYLSTDELIHLFVDVVSKNGNLLLNVGPKADGTLEPLQVDRIEELGRWLDIHGDAIYGSRPFVHFGSSTDRGDDVRFTTKGSVLNIFLFNPRPGDIIVDNLFIPEDSLVHLLGSSTRIEFEVLPGKTRFHLPEKITHPTCCVISVDKGAGLIKTGAGSHFESRYGKIFRREGFLKLDL